jgi:hypothetical protein
MFDDVYLQRNVMYLHFGHRGAVLRVVFVVTRNNENISYLSAKPV